MKLNYCFRCKNLWKLGDGSLFSLRLDKGKKAKIISKECPRCYLYLGDFNIQILWDYVKDNKWETEVHSKHFINIIFKRNPNFSYLMTKEKQIDFSQRLSQFILNVSIAKKVMIEDIEKELFNSLTFV